MTIRQLNFTDRLIHGAQNALQVVTGTAAAGRPYPVTDFTTTKTTSPDLEPGAQPTCMERTSGALMRVNHVGEICAQALYQGQALTALQPSIRAQFERAAKEERDHLVWTARRLSELKARPSYLGPVWYAGSFALGALVGLAGDKASLGFMAETETQVEQHLASHLNRLPAQDLRSREIVARMKQDETEHASCARQLGGTELPWPVPQVMRIAARFMTTVAHRI